MVAFIRPGFKPSVRRSAADTRAAEAITRKRAAHAAADRLFKSAEPVAKVEPGPSAFLSNYGGANNLPSLAPATPARKAEVPELHAKAAALAGRTGPQGLRVLSEIARQSGAAGTPVDISAGDVAELLDLPRAKAATVLDGLVSSGLLIEKRSTFGARIGFVVASV